jgi:hypothetical protein
MTDHETASKTLLTNMTSHRRSSEEGRGRIISETAPFRGRATKRDRERIKEDRERVLRERWAPSDMVFRLMLRAQPKSNGGADHLRLDGKQDFPTIPKTITSRLGLKTDDT